TCSAAFYDDGGADSNYGNNRDYTLTFMPATEGAQIEVEFISFETESSYDFLYIYDGTSTSATQIGQYHGLNGPGTVTATNEAGALTFRFTSDASVNRTGWQATVRCLGIVYDPLEVVATADPEIINEGEESQLNAVVTGGDGNYYYHWEPATTLNNSHIANPVAKPELPTEYIVTVTDGEGNVATASVFVDIRNLGVGENSLDGVSVYPNPSDGHLHIEGLHGITNYRIMNSLGQIMLEGQCQDQLDLETSLPQGVYLLRLDNGASTSTLKIAIK
ncbi:MAG: T9SS type A sorting domain-containing protein, partial [Bacteroidales bacterium]|nr:T9SS type A sorting domain-containing protein [Bacteroidales bacterium]